MERSNNLIVIFRHMVKPCGLSAAGCEDNKSPRILLGSTGVPVVTELAGGL